MGLFDNIPVLSTINPSGLLTFVTKFLLILGLFLICGGVLFYVLYRRNKKILYNKHMHFFERMPGNPLAPSDDYMACEMTIPKTNLKVYYIKEIDLYLPKPSRNMGKNHYWYAVRDNKEIVNFRLKDLNKELCEAGLDYDHSDMRAPNEFLKELINRNYRDKATPWWKEYKELIATVILIFVLGVTFFFLFSKLGGLVDKIGILIDHADLLVKSAEASRTSGVIKV